MSSYTRRALSRIACDSFCERNCPCRCTFCSIVCSACYLAPEQWNYHQQPSKFWPFSVFVASTACDWTRCPWPPWPDIAVNWKDIFWSLTCYHFLRHTRRAVNHITCVCFCKLKYPRQSKFCTFLSIVLCPDKKICLIETFYTTKWSTPFLVLFLLPSPQVAEHDVQAPHGPASQLTGGKSKK